MHYNRRVEHRWDVGDNPITVAVVNRGRVSLHTPAFYFQREDKEDNEHNCEGFNLQLTKNAARRLHADLEREVGIAPLPSDEAPEPVKNTPINER